MVKCRACGFSHGPMVRCEVARRLATNAVKPAINAPVNATNAGAEATNAATNGGGVIRTKANGETPLDQPVIPVVAEKVTGVDSPERRTLNRRLVAAYNAYQRDYMRVYRAVKAGRASRI